MVSNFLGFISFLLQVATILIIIRTVMSWFSPRPTNALAIYLYRVTEPILAPLRQIMPRTGMIDFSPLLAILLLQLMVGILNRLY